MCGCIGGTCVQYDKGAKGKRYSADKKNCKEGDKGFAVDTFDIDIWGVYSRSRLQ